MIDIDKKLLKYSINYKTLKSFLKRLNKQEASSRSNNLTITINEKNYEELFYPEYPGKENILFNKLLELETTGLISIEYGVKRTNEPLWNRRTKILFNLEFEIFCRTTLEMPSQTSLEIWKRLIANTSLSILLKNIFSSKEIIIYGKKQQEIIQNIEKKLPLIKNGMTNRQISSILFWGLSKVLDNKKEIVSVLGGNSPALMLNVCAISNDFSEVLFIENYDTYVDYINQNSFEKYIIIYSAGFSTSALRIRERNGCSLHYSNQNELDEKNRMRFESWFFKESEENIKISFFGDFDFSGISIFDALRNLFPKIIMYRGGYDFMLNEVQNGNGHLPEMASKENQKDPKIVNDAYCDGVLLPAMRQYGFFDQEGVVYK